MERLWTPWRYEYVSRSNDDTRPGVPKELSAWSESGAPDTGCVFCNMIAAADFAISHGMPRDDAERATHILKRGPNCFLCLNAFPYSTGHILIVPYEHASSLSALPHQTAQEIIGHAQRVETALRAVYHPSGLNFGLNLGEAAGAGIAAHIHMHALPRWIGDTNFMTVTANTRVLPETLDITWDRVRAALQQNAPTQAPAAPGS